MTTTLIDKFRQEDSPVACALVDAYDHAGKQYAFWRKKPGREAALSRSRWGTARTTLEDLAGAILLRRDAQTRKETGYEMGNC